MKSKGDGTDLCCIVNPVRWHKHCDLSFCKDHGWNTGREKLGLGRLSVDLKLSDGCPRCGKVAGVEKEWRTIGSGRE